MKHIDFVASVAIAITTSVTPIIPAAETFGPLALGRLESFYATASRLSRHFRRLIDATILAHEQAIVLFASSKRRDPEPKGISIYRVNAANAHSLGDIDLIRDRTRTDDRDRLGELARSLRVVNRAYRVWKARLRDGLTP